MLTSGHMYGKGKTRRLLVLLFLASLIVCAVPAADAAKLKAELVNKEPEGILASMPTGPVQLTYPNGRTRLLPYRSHLQPVVANGKVYIFTTKDLEVTGIVIYDSAKGRGQTFPLPEDLKCNNYFGQPSFSPDGTKVAYYFVSDQGMPSQPEKRRIEPKRWFIDRTGKIVPKPTVPQQKRQEPGSLEFSEGLAPVAAKKGRLISRGEGRKKFIDFKMGFKDLTGKVVIPPQFDDVGYFSEGLAPVRVGEKWGYIDKTGKIVIPPQYANAHSFWEGRAAVNIGSKWGYGKWGFIDKMGKMVIPPRYDYVGNFSEGLAWVAVDGKYGFIDQAGTMVIPPQYDYAGTFSQGVASVGKEAGEVFGGGVRVRSWPDWVLLWQGPLCELGGGDSPPVAPIWEKNSLVEFDPLFFDPPRFLKYQVPEPGKSDKNKPEKSE
jgi:hypothetical protein